MDFRKAADRMVNSLTLQEKALAKEYAEAVFLEAKTRTVYLRSPVQRLEESLAQANRLVSDAELQEPLRRLVVYCDTLEIPENIVVAHADRNKELDLRIFARKLHCLGNAQNAWQMNLSTNSVLDIFTYSLPSGFAIQFLSADGTSKLCPLAIDQNKWGIQVAWTGDEFYTEQCGPAMLDMSTADYLDRLNPDGTVKTGPHINDNLPRLVYYQFLVAASSFYTDRKLALDILNWVCNLSASETTVALNIQACSLRNSLILSESQNVFNVPSVNIYASKQVLKSRLIAAKAFEDAFQSFVAQDRMTTNFAGLTGNMLARSNDAITEYQFLEALARKAYDAALAANDVAQKRFAENEATLKNLKKTFEAGIEAWSAAKKQEATIEVFKAVVEVVGAVAATVATGGLAAPSIGAALKSGAGLIKALGDIFKQIEELYEKLQPVIESLSKLGSAIAGVVAAIDAAQQLQNDTSAVQRPNMDLDVLNATALWDIFREKIDDMEQAILSVDCDGKREYLLALRTLAINGKTYLQTQENVCLRGNEFAVVLLKLKLQHRDQTRLELSSTALSQQDTVLDILRRAMFDRLLTIRSLVFVDFQMYTEAYMFHALTSIPPINFSPVQPVADFLDAAAKLQGCIATFGSRVAVQRRRFAVRTLGNTTGVTDLRRRLRAGESITVSLRPDDAMFRGFSRIRVSRVRCYLDGAKAMRSGVETQALRIHLRTSGRFSDIALPGTRSKDATSAEAVPNFVGDARTLLFEYDIEDKTIVCDGEHSQPRDYTLQTPLTEWDVAIADGGLGVNDIDLDGLTGLRMEFWCDVTLRDV